MIFSLELLQAKQGDCLLLHYGSPQQENIIIIDGGPGRHFNTYRETLKPRLKQIKDKLSPNEPLPISMTMISHMDDDHAAGILRMLQDIESDVEDNIPPYIDIKHLWFNTFDDIIGNIEIPQIADLSSGAAIATIAAQIPGLANMEEHTAAVIASTRQGRIIRDLANKLTIPVNSPFPEMGANKPPMVRADVGSNTIEWDPGLRIQVLHPNFNRLQEMQQKWDTDLKKAHANNDPDIIFASIASRDKSPFNLASIVCLVEFHGKRILLTGDSRDDDILQGLEEANLLDSNGQILVDILKIPHHGSDRNASRHFFERVQARHYVISGDGSHHNPDKSTLVMLSMATRGRNDFTIHMSNEEGKNDLEQILHEFIEDDRARGRTYGFEFREKHKSSKTIDLLQQIDY